MSTKFQVLNKLEFVKIIDNKITKFWKRDKEQHGHNAHVEREEVQNIVWKQTIAEMRANGALKIYNVFPIQNDSNEI